LDKTEKLKKGAGKKTPGKITVISRHPPGDLSNNSRGQKAKYTKSKWGGESKTPKGESAKKLKLATGR